MKNPAPLLTVYLTMTQIHDYTRSEDGNGGFKMQSFQVGKTAVRHIEFELCGNVIKSLGILFSGYCSAWVSQNLVWPALGFVLNLGRSLSPKPQ